MCAPFLPVLVSASLKERQLREWRPSVIHGKLLASSCPIEVPASYFYPPTLFPFPRSFLLSTSLKISANSLALPCCYLFLSSILLCILLCRSLALPSTGISPLYINQSEVDQSHGFSFALLPSTRSVVSLFGRSHSMPSSFRASHLNHFVVVGHELACFLKLLTFDSHIQSHWPS
jgi:hypothetical protein